MAKSDYMPPDDTGKAALFLHVAESGHMRGGRVAGRTHLEFRIEFSACATRSFSSRNKLP